MPAVRIAVYHDTNGPVRPDSFLELAAQTRRSVPRTSRTAPLCATCPPANTVWMWGALLAVNLSAWPQELAGLDTGDGRGRAHLGTLRHRLLTYRVGWSATPGRSPCGCLQDANCWPRSWPGCAGCPSGP